MEDKARREIGPLYWERRDGKGYRSYRDFLAEGGGSTFKKDEDE